jgi:hypothetical protein
MSDQADIHSSNVSRIIAFHQLKQPSSFSSAQLETVQAFRNKASTLAKPSIECARVAAAQMLDDHVQHILAS